MVRALIVDDSAFMRQLIREALESLGIIIVGEANNGLEALSHYHAHTPDLITLDVVMPDMDGLEFLTILREEDQATNVIMVTAIDQRDSMLTAMTLGVTDFVVKPFDRDRIIAAVERATESLSTRGGVED
jgi:two-component system chemotaxis response regulator CheY